MSRGMGPQQTWTAGGVGGPVCAAAGYRGVPTREPSMKRDSQSRTEHQKSETAAPKNPAFSEKTQSNQSLGGSPEYDQPAAPGTAMGFSFKGCAVRTVLYEGGTWFVAADICAVLELTDPTAALLRLDEDEKGPTTIRTLGGNQKMNVVSESGLYHLTFTSRKPQAKAFRRWVTGTVLPSIRRTGGYQTKDHARILGSDEDGRQDAVTVALPGPGRYVATVMPDGGGPRPRDRIQRSPRRDDPRRLPDPVPHAAHHRGPMAQNTSTGGP